nr:DUF4396 domain-containing protein [Acidiphilium sp.]
MTSDWLFWLSVASLIAAVVSAGIIIADLRNRPQDMTVMYPVWPITALYFGPFGLLAYWRMGRKPRRDERAQDAQQGHHHHHGGDRPFWVAVFGSSTHCGAGCTLGDIIAEFIVFFGGLAAAGSVFGAELILDYAFAFILGIIFQYASIVPMRGLRPVEGVIAAIKADALSLTSFEIGLFGWMALMRFVFFHPALEPDSPVFWFMMHDRHDHRLCHNLSDELVPAEGRHQRRVHVTAQGISRVNMMSHRRWSRHSVIHIDAGALLLPLECGRRSVHPPWGY